MKIPVDRKEFVIKTDVSDKRIGAILAVEKDRKFIPIEFHLKTFNDTMRRWDVQKKEAYAIILAFKKFDRLVRRMLIKIYINHQTLQLFKECTKTKIYQYVSLLAEYNIQIFYKKAGELVHIDYISYNIEEESDYMDDRMFAFIT